MDFLFQTFTLFQKGGPVMYVMLICSFFALAIGADRFFYLKSVSKDTRKFRGEFIKYIENNNIKAAESLCKKYDFNVLARVAYAGLDAISHNKGLENALESVASLEALRLQDHLEDLSLLVTLSPLLGLLGTILGMIHSFSVFDLQSGHPSAITGGIGEALIATATGLCIASISLLMHRFFSRRISIIKVEMEQIASQIVGNIYIYDAGKMEYINHENF